MHMRLFPPEEPAENEIFQAVVQQMDRAIEGVGRIQANYQTVTLPALRAADEITARLIQQHLNALEGIAEVTGRGSYTSDLHRLPEKKRLKWTHVRAFLEHDIAHIDEGSLIENAIQVAYSLPAGDQGQEKTPFPAPWEGHYRNLIETFGDQIGQLRYPYEFTRALAQKESGQPIDRIERVDLEAMLKTIARSIQTRFVFDQFQLTTPTTRRPELNEIILNAQPGVLTTNAGMMWSVLYNLIKNAAKELSYERKDFDPKDNESPLDRAIRGETPLSPVKIGVSMETLEEIDVTLIHITDTGNGLKADEILESLRKILSRELIESSDLRASVKKALRQWEVNPYVIRTLKMGDIYDFAGLARASGFANRVDSPSSGMGLWGVNYLTQSMGAEIIYTNTYEGGAMFTLVLPNHFFDAEPRVGRTITKTTRNRLIQGKLLTEYPRFKKAA